MKKARLLVPFLLVFPAAIGAHSAAAPAVSGKVWVNHSLEYEELLRTAEVVQVEDIGSGVNHPKRVTLKKGDKTIRAVWKPITRGRQDWGWESFQAEVAAYEMDKLLGLDMVPPTVARLVNGEKGSLQLWLDGYRLYEDVRTEVPSSEKFTRQIETMKLFDCLICNRDRKPSDFMVDGDWNIVLIDHSQAFMSHADLEDVPEKLPTLFNKRLVEKLESLSRDRVQMRFGRLLLDPEITGILSRRDALLDHMNKLIAEKGKDAVVY